jgi:4'-phosphopantetheinyl transferase EntD
VSYPGVPAVPPHPGKPGGVYVVAREILGYLGVSSSVGGWPALPAWPSPVSGSITR